jgi:precorrin-6B methylase 2
MPDVYSNIAALDAAMQDRLADVLETRGADRQQQELRRTFLADIEFPADARVLEVGCGTGVLTRMETGSFFGHVAYVSLIARKPG